jgi:TolB protein
MNIDGSNVRYLEEGLSPAWSPSGESIIFYKPLSDKIQDVGYLYSIGVDGNNLSQLTEDVYAGSPAWSHDGKMIAFHGYEDNGENDGIYVMDSTGENLTFLTSIGGKPSWLPDSSQILVAEDGKLFIVSLDGSVQEFLNSNLSDYYFLYAAIQP